MSNLTRAMMMGAAGASGDKTYVDDVFSTFLYTGNDTAGHQINNGIDLAGEGGIVWVKKRSDTDNNLITNTAGKILRTNLTDTESTSTNFISSFNSNGFTLGQGVQGSNSGGADIASWTFRKAPGFLDVVTWNGNNGSGLRTINHNLGSTPAFIIARSSNSGSQWYCWHKDLTSKNYYILLNDAGAQGNAGAQVWDATDTTFSIHSGVVGNTTNTEYFAYLFADNDPVFGTGGDESIIKCGKYTGTGTGSNPTINLGFEPQWLMIKNSTTGSDQYGNADWYIADIMRGMATSGSRFLLANENNAEANGGRIVPTDTGFTIVNESSIDYNASGDTYIYMAIRRPNKPLNAFDPPLDATDVFAISTRLARSTSGSSYPRALSNFPVDAVIRRNDIHQTGSPYIASRITATGNITDSAAVEFSQGFSFFASNIGASNDSTGAAETTDYYWMFKRAPGFMDVVSYIGTGTNSAGTQQVVNHNLGVTPELVIVKNGDSSKSFFVWSSYMTEKYRMRLDDAAQQLSGGDTYWQANSTFTATQFGLGYGVNTNKSPDRHVAYLFASLAGISKIGTYSGTGADINVNCGFISGARFVLIKRTDAEVMDGYTPMSGWYVWDTTRGIVSGDDPYLRLDSNAAQVTNTDYIDPLSTGFTVTSSASASLNANGGTYLFLAIA